ncbi:MAG: N-(5'-phosphoribosyl)anthranilate isomerase [Candidatus Binatia bacterium]|nr:MAG: N-(5'-phosphoribosyl)anthranilate isomerase [Candidatus Binatia bacterium]
MPGPVRVQIAGVASWEEALFAASEGADALGFPLRLPTGDPDLSEEAVRAIVAKLPVFVDAVAITYVETAQEAIDLCRFLGVTVLQLHGEFPGAETRRIRAALPYLRIVRAVPVTGPEALDEARRLEREADALILDTYDPRTGRRGATGLVHDWNVSREIARAVRVPVILAGGLRPENVGQAIETVRPWAVDVHTGVEEPDGTRSLAKIREFIRRAKAAGAVEP